MSHHDGGMVWGWCTSGKNRLHTIRPSTTLPEPESGAAFR
jgi:hypothetical protein